MSKEVKFKQVPNEDAELSLLNLPAKNLPQKKTFLDRIKENRSFKKILKLRGIIYAVLSAFFIALANIFNKKSNFFGGSEQSAIRYFIQLIIMIIIVKIQGEPLFGAKGQRILLSLRGFMGVFSLLGIYFSVKLINPSDASALVNTNIIMVSVMARIILKEKYSFADLFGLIMTIVGILFIAQPPFMFPRKAKKINEKFISLFLNSSDPDNSNHFYNCSPIKYHFVDFSSSLANVEKKLASFEYGLIRSLNETKNHTSQLEFETRVLLNESMVIFRNTSAICGPVPESVLKKALGISMAIMGAVALTGVTILLKKLNNRSVHYSVNLAYASYFGFPISLFISIILIVTGVEKKNKVFLENPSLIAEQTAYSVASAICAIYSQFLMVISMRHEEASKACLFRATDLFFTFALQYIILSIKPNLYNTIGSNLIFLGVLVIMVHKILDQKFNKNKKETAENPNSESENILKTIVFFKF